MGLDLQGSKSKKPKLTISSKSLVSNKTRTRWYDTDGVNVYKYAAVGDNDSPTYVVTGTYTIDNFKKGMIAFDGITKENMQKIIKDLKL